MEASVSEIHRYPPRPAGFVEPLFATEESRREIAEHLLDAPWLSRASELPEKGGSAVHSAEEPVPATPVRRWASGDLTCFPFP